MKIECVLFSDKYECLPKIVGILDTGKRRILAGSKECLEILVREHVSDNAAIEKLLADIENECPLPLTTEELPREHRVLICLLNRSDPNMWEGIIGHWVDPMRRSKVQV